MANWRDEMEHLGLDLRDGGRSLLDFEVCRRLFNIWHGLPCYWRTLKQTCGKPLAHWDYN